MTQQETTTPLQPFPTNGLIPKDEIQATSFLERFPEYDGRGIRVAVLDSGVDPSAFGLDGKNKVVDIIDCTGLGDVPLSIVQPLSRSATDQGNDIRLPAQSGRILLVSKTWSNPTGIWRVGFRRAYEIWPNDLIDRFKRERKPEWESEVAGLYAEARKQLDQLSGSENEGEATAQRSRKKDLEDQLDYLKQLEFDDPGPLLDVVVWQDGDTWRSVVGGTETTVIDSVRLVKKRSAEGQQPEHTTIVGSNSFPSQELDLRARKPMADYAKERHWERFGKQDLLTYSVKFYMDENIISICCACSTHGTHVASIIGANVSDSQDLSGNAPGVEIVSIKIGANRFGGGGAGGGELGRAHMRALKAILDTECDICNLSWGNTTTYGLENQGLFSSMLREEVIKKRKVLFVAAAGNDGPALSTFSAPAAMSGIISVGALQTAALQASSYALLDNVPEGPFTWSSRGPTFDGSEITVWAPGGAIAGVSSFGLQKTALINGTSMSSPSVCGGIALVLSALKAQGISWTSARVEQAIRATSKPSEGTESCPLFQIEAFYEYIVQHEDQPECDADFEIYVTTQGQEEPDSTKPFEERSGQRGVYLREKDETSRLYEASCYVRPSFARDEDTEKLFGLDLKLSLACSEAWVKAPQHVSLASGGRGFDIQVDPTRLPVGPNYASIQAFDVNAGGRRVFSIPVCVIKPEKVDNPTITKTFNTSPGHTERLFLSVPEGATWYELTIGSEDNATPAELYVQAVQIRPAESIDLSKKRFIVKLLRGQEDKRNLSIQAGVTVELCISQYWNCQSKANVTVKVDFHGLVLDTGNRITILGGQAPPPLQVRSELRVEHFSPAVDFDRLELQLHPTYSKLAPRGARDVLPENRHTYQLLNIYTFTLTEPSRVKCVVPFGSFYDSALSITTRLQDCRGRIIGWGTAKPQEMQLESGVFTVLFSIESPEYKVLEKYKTLAIGLQVQLGEKGKNLSLHVYKNQTIASKKGESCTFINVKMQVGETRPLVIGSELIARKSSIYKIAKAGDALLGRLQLQSSTENADVDLIYVIPPKPKEDSSEEGGEDGKDAPLLVDLQLGLLEKIKDEKQRKKFLDTILAENPKHLPALVAALKTLKADEADPKDVTKAADAVLAEIDENAIAIHLGKKALPAIEQSEDDEKTQKAMEEKKKAWANAYARKIEASYKSNDGLAAQNKLFEKYRLFVDAPEKDQEFSLISAKRDFAQQRYGSALSTIKKMLEEGLDKDKYKEVTQLESKCYSELGWAALLEYKARWKLVKEPNGEELW